MPSTSPTTHTHTHPTQPPSHIPHDAQTHAIPLTDTTQPKHPTVDNPNQVLRPKPALLSEMTRFHSDDYVNFLRVITPDNMQEYMRQLQRCVRPLLLF